jgi:hypothetical protein
MKLVQSLIVAALVSIPVVSFAQAQQPLTRSEVRAELVQLQKAGYSAAAGDEAHYPSNLQAAQARIDADNGSAAAAYGGVAKGGSASGSRAPMRHAKASAPDVIGLGDIYAHS